MEKTDPNIINVAFVDDHIGIIKHGAEYIQNHCPRIRVLFVAPDGLAMQKHLMDIDAPQPDIVIMDIRMKPMDGYASTAWLLKNRPGIKVLVHTAINRMEAAANFLAYGVRAFVDKSSDSDVLIDAICHLADRGYFINEYLTVQKLKQLDSKIAHLATYTLTDRQREVFRRMQSGQLDREIAEGLFIEVTTVRDHVNKAKEKFNIYDRKELLNHLNALGLLT